MTSPTLLPAESTSPPVVYEVTTTPPELPVNLKFLVIELPMADTITFPNCWLVAIVLILSPHTRTPDERFPKSISTATPVVLIIDLIQLSALSLNATETFIFIIPQISTF